MVLALVIYIYFICLFFVGLIQVLIFLSKLFNRKKAEQDKHLRKYFIMLASYSIGCLVYYCLNKYFSCELNEYLSDSVLFSTFCILYVAVLPLPIAYYFFKNIMFK